MTEQNTRRRFEFKSDRSYKYWAIEIHKRTVTVNYGQIGSKGQRRDKTFDSREKAQTFYDKKVKEKKRAGYKEVVKQKVERKSNEEQRLELQPHEPFIEAICEAEDRTEASLIYADWLMENGDPRGEFIRCQLEMEDCETPMWKQAELEKQSANLLLANWREWLAELSQFYHETDVHMNFAGGFLDKVSFACLCEKKATALKNNTLCRLIRHFTINSTWGGDPKTPMEIDALEEADFSSLQSFEFSSRLSNWEGSFSSTRHQRSGTPTFQTIRRMGQLKRLTLDVGFHGSDYQQLFSSQLPKLKHFTIKDDMAVNVAEQLAGSHWMKQLVTLTLSCRLTVPTCQQLAKVIDPDVLIELSLWEHLEQRKLDILKEAGVPISLFT